VWQFYQRTLPEDCQGGGKNVRFLTFKPHVLMAETKLNNVALKMKVNMRRLI
jgi:hypothetical protein